MGCNRGLGILLVVIIFLSAFNIYLYNSNDDKDEFKGTVTSKLIMDEEVKYQGPVPQGYDLERFRRSGETVLKDKA